MARAQTGGGMKPKGHSAVMASRSEAPDSLDFFPTPPWATRALLDVIRHEVDEDMTCWEPACGAGHMAGVLAELPWRVFASDVHDYGHCDAIGSFVGEGLDVLPERHADWIITNPPFRLAVDFAERALAIASEGVALLVRTSWLEGGDRYTRLFDPYPPTMIVQFAERVPMVKGRWDPEASTATSYCWVIWIRQPVHARMLTRFAWVPPGSRKRLTLDTDAARYAGDRGYREVAA